MHAPAPDKDVQPTDPSVMDLVLDHLGRVSYIRGHISLFAVGSVVLLGLDLISGDTAVWADTLIGAWAVLLVAHGILAVIARLMIELLAEDDSDIRPASEMRWSSPSTWRQPPRSPRSPVTAPTPSPAPTPAPASVSPEPGDETRHTATEPESADEGERVSWQAATDAAWLAHHDDPPENDEADTTRKPEKPRPFDDPNDFTPLKLD